MIKNIIYSLSILSVFLLSLSCKKTCPISGEDIDSGEILKDVIVYPKSGGVTANSGGNWVYNASHTQSESLEISTDGGYTKYAVDHSQYTILGFPLSVNCDAAFIRDVTIDHENQQVIYTNTVKDCSDDCPQKRIVENFVVVPAFPENYAVIFNQK